MWHHVESSVLEYSLYPPYRDQAALDHREHVLVCKWGRVLTCLEMIVRPSLCSCASAPMTTPISQYFDELELGPAMAQNQAGHSVAISESSIQYDPAIRYQLRTTASPNFNTTNPQDSINSTSLRFNIIKRQSNKRAEFHGNGFVVIFRNSTSKKICCDCSNAVPCSVRTIQLAMTMYCP